MRILYFVPRYWPGVGGAELVSRELIHRLRSRFDVAVVRHCSTETGQPEVVLARAKTLVSDDEGLPVYQIGPQGIWRLCAQAASRFRPGSRYMQPIFGASLEAGISSQFHSVAKPFDLIHAIYNHSSFRSMEVAQRIARRLRIPFVWTPLPHVSHEGSSWATPRFRRLYRQADALIALTAFEREWLVEQGAAPGRVHVCPVGPILSGGGSAEAFRSRYALGTVPIVLFVARQVSYKGYQHIWEAAPAVWDSAPETQFVLIGPQTEESIAYFTRRQDRRFLNLGEVTSEEKLSALAASDVLCVPSIQESLGVVYLEAWSYRKPVIAADIPVIHEVVSDGEDGLIVPQSAPAIARALISLLENPELRRRMGEAGFKKVSTEYGWPALADRVAVVYESLLGG